MKVTYNDREYDISGVAINSAEVAPGFAFFCIVGSAKDGHAYASDAVARGASFIFCEHELPELRGADVREVTTILVDDTHKAAAEVASQFYGYPSREVQLVGVTGTNGKTTTCNVIAHILETSGKKTAVIGTTGIYIDESRDNAWQTGLQFDGRTTPDCISIQKLFRALVDLGVEAIIMEVSSHALDQKRVWGTDFDVCAFTNLTQDHLDYHKTMENYFAAKALLFGQDYPGNKVVCIDDEWGQRLAEIACGDVACGDIARGNIASSDIARAVECDDDLSARSGRHVITCGFSANADVNPQNYGCDFPLIGRFNIQNMLVAVSVCKCLGLCDEDIQAALASTPQVAGRMQVVGPATAGIRADQGATAGKLDIPTVVVDYAHTPDALKNTASTLSEIVHSKNFDDTAKNSINAQQSKTDAGKLIVVFGCGGDRDKTKRPQMARVATSIADFTIITTDNPRTEEPASIIKDIVPGVVEDAKYCVIEDRQEAIGHAIAQAGINDIVLVAGKGHEDYQEINGVKHHFDDREIAAECLDEWLASNNNKQ